MRQNLRPQRNVFLLFLGATFVALMGALPLVTAQTQSQEQKPAQQEQKPAPQAAQQAAPQLDHPGFEQADRNKDGLSANFERADRNRDGKLDRAEFDKGLQILQVRR